MVEIRRASGRMMTLVVVFEEDVLRLSCGYAPQGGRCLEEKQAFNDVLKCEWDTQAADDLVMCLGDINGHIGRHIDSFDGMNGGYGVGKRKLERGIILEFYLEKELCVSNTWLRKEEKRKMTVRMGENKTEVDFVLTKKEHRRIM